MCVRVCWVVEGLYVWACRSIYPPEITPTRQFNALLSLDTLLCVGRTAVQNCFPPNKALRVLVESNSIVKSGEETAICHRLSTVPMAINGKQQSKCVELRWDLLQISFRLSFSPLTHYHIISLFPPHTAPPPSPNLLSSLTLYVFSLFFDFFLLPLLNLWFALLFPPLLSNLSHSFPFAQISLSLSLSFVLSHCFVCIFSSSNSLCSLLPFIYVL